MPDIAVVKAEFFRAIAHPVRIRVLELLSDAERTVGELQAQLGLEQSHLSHQLGVLRRAGVVVTRREGSSVVYALDDPRMAEILTTARRILLDAATRAQRGLAAS
jgi:ArsR family transcriptional regulator